MMNGGKAMSIWLQVFSFKHILFLRLKNIYLFDGSLRIGGFFCPDSVVSLEIASFICWVDAQILYLTLQDSKNST